MQEHHGTNQQPASATAAPASTATTSTPCPHHNSAMSSLFLLLGHPITPALPTKTTVAKHNWDVECELESLAREILRRTKEAGAASTATSSSAPGTSSSAAAAQRTPPNIHPSFHARIDCRPASNWAEYLQLINSGPGALTNIIHCHGSINERTGTGTVAVLAELVDGTGHLRWLLAIVQKWKRVGKQWMLRDVSSARGPDLSSCPDSHHHERV